MQRRVQPEILDQLAPDDPAAIHNRRDLRFFNALMGNHRWIERTLRQHRRPGDRVIELGAGEGDLGRRLAANLGNNGWTCAGLDLWPRPVDWPAEWSWHREDLANFSHYDQYNVVLGNLILHQFEDDVLAELGRRWRDHARLLIFCEPARHPLHLWQLPLARLAGTNHVSNHDARVSIEGGFIGNDLANTLGLAAPAWKVTTNHTFLGGYRFVATRDEA